MDREKSKALQQIDKSIREIETCLKNAKAVRAELASEPPALSHGDYCQPHSKKIICIALNCPMHDGSFDIWAINEQNKPYLYGQVPKTTKYYTPIGISIFDDLSALTEDVEELKLSSPDGTLHLDIELSIDGKYVVFSMINEFNDKQLSLTLPTNIVTKSNIKAFLATALRKAKGESNE